MQIKERFIEVCNVDTAGQELLLQKNGLELKNMYGQGYDGAANMSGTYKGLRARILAHNEKALFVHCKAHCLNLVLVEASKSNKNFVTFFNLAEKLYAFCTGLGEMAGVPVSWTACYGTPAASDTTMMGLQAENTEGLSEKSESYFEAP